MRMMSGLRAGFALRKRQRRNGERERQDEEKHVFHGKSPGRVVKMCYRFSEPEA